MRYGRGSLILGVVIFVGGIAAAVTSGIGSGLVNLALGSWVIVRSAIRLRRPRPEHKQWTDSELRRLGFRFVLLGAAMIAFACVGLARVIPPFDGGHTWPFFGLLLPGAFFCYMGVRVLRARPEPQQPKI
jgi:hypothetical protein